MKFRYSKIKKIERRPCNRPVYNLAVQDDESYLAENVVVHNCRSILVPVTIFDDIDDSAFVSPSLAGRAIEQAGKGFVK